LRPFDRPTAAALVLALACAAQPMPPHERIEEPQIARLLAGAWIHHLTRCSAAPDGRLRVTLYIVPDPREEATYEILSFCPVREAHLAVSSCDARPRHAVHRLPDRCFWGAPWSDGSTDGVAHVQLQAIELHDDFQIVELYDLRVDLRGVEVVSLKHIEYPSPEQRGKSPRAAGPESEPDEPQATELHR
jgi:hypothetical protein